MRAKQFYRAITSKMSNEDNQFVHIHLSPKEAKLFYGMDKAIQKHCVNVANTARQLHPHFGTEDFELLTKASLLHDVGKLEGTLTVFDRVLFVFLERFFPEVLRDCPESWQGLYTIKHHPSTGAKLAKDQNVDETLIYLIREHQNKSEASHSRILKALIEADELN